MPDILFKNCRVIDGTGSPWFPADVAVTGDIITAIAPRIETESETKTEAGRVVDLKNLILCPGFIDMHTHSDLRVLAHPEEKTKLMQGITTALIGQDGLSAAPISDAEKEPMRRRLAGLNGDYAPHWNWNRMGEYLDAIDVVRPAANSVMLAPHGAVRATAMGWEKRPPTSAELARMRQLLNESFDDGAVGFSTGLIYPPGMYADREELLSLLSLTAARGGFFVVHMRNESDYLLQAIDEVVELCLTTGCPLHISHLKVAGKRNSGASEKVIEKLDKASASGLELTFDQYPYTAGSTMLDALIPPSRHSGGNTVLLENLKDPSFRADALNIVEERTPEKWENWVATCGWKNIYINATATERNRDAEGKSLAELAEIRGQHPFDVVADLLIQENGGVTMTIFYGHEQDLVRFMKDERGMLCTDGIAGGKPHPRLYGSTARILGKYVREEKILTLPQAIRRMTSFPSRRLGLSDRGILREGMKADLVAFDPDTVLEKGTYEEPNSYPVGFRLVTVAGAIVMENGELTGLRPGKTLRGRG